MIYLLFIMCSVGFIGSILSIFVYMYFEKRIDEMDKFIANMNQYIKSIK